MPGSGSNKANIRPDKAAVYIPRVLMFPDAHVKNYISIPRIGYAYPDIHNQNYVSIPGVISTPDIICIDTLQKKIKG